MSSFEDTKQNKVLRIKIRNTNAMKKKCKLARSHFHEDLEEANFSFKKGKESSVSSLLS
jgi:hypothetical protein